MSMLPWRRSRDARDEIQPMDASLARLRTEIEHVFDRFLGDAWGISPLESLPARLGWGVRIDVSESDTRLVIKAELPGVDPHDVDVAVRGNLLSISGDKTRESEGDAGGFLYAERQYGRFERSVQLPTSVDTGNVNAEFKSGVLTITLSKHPETSPKLIKVRRG